MACLVPGIRLLLRICGPGIPALLLGLPVAAGAQAPPEHSAGRLEGLLIAEVRLEGLSRTTEDVVRRRMLTRPGERFRHETALRDERVITALGLFWSVHIKAEPLESQSAAPSEVIVTVRLRERLGWFIMPEIDWTPEQGWSYGLTGGHLNVMRRGHRLFGTAMVGPASVFSISLGNPWSGASRQSFLVNLRRTRLSSRLYRIRETNNWFGLQAGRWFGEWARMAGGMLYRQLRTPEPGTTMSDTGLDRMHLVWFYLGFDTSDPWNVPRRGLNGGIRLEGYGGPLGGNVQGHALLAEVAGALPLRHTVLLLAGRTLAEAQLGRDRPFWRLRSLGGPMSLRGYPLGHWLVERRLESALELQWYFLPMRTYPTGLAGDQIVGLSLALFADAGFGHGLRRGPGSEQGVGRTPLAGSAGLCLRLHHALLGTARSGIAWSDRGQSQIYTVWGSYF
jgi:outer membrane protein assembly factor BamA